MKESSKQPLEPWRRNLYIVWGAQFIAMMGMSLVVPFLPFYIRSLGVTETNEVSRWSGLVFAGPFLPAFILTPVWGYLGDRYGRKLMTVRAIFGLALSQVLIGLSPTVEALFFFRMVQGAISGFLASALTLVSANTPKERAGYAIGLLQTATSSGNVIGPLVGGSLADTFGYRPIFFLVGGLCVVTGFIVIRFVHETNPSNISAKPVHSLISNYSYALRSVHVRVAMLIILVSQMAVFLIQPIFALYVDSLLAGGRYLATAAGAVFSVAGFFTVLAAPWWGRRNDSRSYRKNLSLALAGAGISFALQGAAVSVFDLSVYRAALGFFLGGMLPVLYSYVSKNSEMERRGGVLGIASSMNILANLIGAPLGGFAASVLGFRPMFVLAGVLLMAATLLVRKYFVDVRLQSHAPNHDNEHPLAVEEPV